MFQQTHHNGIAKVQSITQEFNGWYQFSHIEEITFNKIHKLGQLTVLLFLSVFIFCICFVCCSSRCKASSSSFMRYCKSSFLRSNAFIFPLPKREPIFVTNEAFISVLAVFSFSDLIFCFTLPNYYSACCCSVCNCCTLASNSHVCRASEPRTPRCNMYFSITLA